METLHLDYETRSVIPLDVRGLDNYARDPSTRVLLAAYAFGDRAVKLWQPHLNPMPDDLREALESPFVTVYAWNAAFEKAITKHVLGIDKPIQEFLDPMCNARYLSLPGGLDAAGEILGIGEDVSKLKVGKRLIKLFCEPEDLGGETTLFGVSEPTFRDWRTDPKDWELFGLYCKQDVVAERTVLKKLVKFPLPEAEWETWRLSEKINERGIPVDMTLVTGARTIVDRETAHLIEQLKKITGLENPNSVSQFLPWVQSQGYAFSSIGKVFVARAMAGECPLTDVAKTALDIRHQTAKSAVKKYTAIADTVSSDGRLRYAYQYMGAARTGRFSSLGANLANLSKPTKQVEKQLDLAVELVQKADYDGIITAFGKPLEVVTSTVRSSFRAPEGFKFVIADLNAIENRGLGYLARCEAILDVYKRGLDPYIEFATRMYGGTYAELWDEYKAGNSTKRTNSKPPVLGAGYSLGPGEKCQTFECESCGNKTVADFDSHQMCRQCGCRMHGDGVAVWTGLMGYARAMGVEMSREEAVRAIEVFRSSYPEVPWLWKDMHHAAAYSIRHPGEIIGVGVPQTQREREYFESLGRTVKEPIISFKCTGTSVLEMILPSGRSLHYIDPEAREEDAEYKGKKYKRTVVTYQGKETGSQQWGPVKSHGGKWTENADQAVSRDILVHGMKLAETKGFEIVIHTYDEIVALAPVNGNLGVKELCDCMTVAPSWCGDAFPLGAEGFESDVYRKG